MDSKSALFAQICAITSLTDPDKQKAMWECLDKYNVKDKDSAVTINDGLTMFLDAKRAEGCSRMTIDTYTQCIKMFSKYEENKKLSEIEAADIRAYMVYLREIRNQRKTTIQHHVCVLRGYFGWLYNEHMIQENPMLRIQSIHVDKRGARHPIKPENVERARNACKTLREKALFEFFLSTGCRLSEVLNIQTRDVDFQSRSVVVTGKGDKQRTVYFSVRAKVFMEEYLSTESKNPSILFSGKRYPYGPLTRDAVQLIIKNIGKRANIDENIFPHKIRHTFATNALTAGMDITAIQQLLGHNDLSTTQIYAETSQAIVQGQYNRLIA